MADGNRKNSFDELDDFWELDALLPPKASPPPRPADVETVEVTLGEKDSKNNIERYVSPYAPQRLQTKPERKYPPITSTRGGAKIDYDAWMQKRKDGDGSSARGNSGDETTVYVPRNPLIFCVRVIRRSDFDSIEERSLGDMRELADATAVFTENVEFTALFPQYSRMTEAQKQCYIGFRTEVLNGRFPKVSEAYILFLLYELINLPERYPAHEAVRIFCSLMREYRACDDALFTFMCDWLADLCLINKMEAPLDQLEPVRERVYKRATWKEFYVPFRAETAEPDACVLLTSASEYDYRMSKFYSQETAEYFEKHVPAAVGAVIRHVSSSDTDFLGTERDVTTLTHNAFRSAFRSAKCRYTVSIDCACFTRSPLLRQTVTCLVKYAENFVREMLGIKSRLSVSCLSTEKKDVIKSYFEPFIKRESDRPPLKRGRKKKIPDVPPIPIVPEYEKYYEPQNSGFSPELAARIENESWHTTDMLLTAFADENGEMAEETPSIATTESPKTSFDAVNPQENKETTAPTKPETASAPHNTRSTPIQALKLLLRGKSREFGDLARENGLLPDTLAEHINQLALDVYGDIAVENDGGFGGFTVIEDYREELEEIARGE